MPHSAQARGDHVGGALFFVAEFGMRVDVAADRFEFGLESEDRFDKSHSVLPMPHVFNYCSPSMQPLPVPARGPQESSKLLVSRRFFRI
jgi:hypothetical protein